MLLCLACTFAFGIQRAVLPCDVVMSSLLSRHEGGDSLVELLDEEDIGDAMVLGVGGVTNVWPWRQDVWSIASADL